ncbi:MAG: hypothetical protein QW133_00080 [Sulfolobales archaeon]
MTLYGVISSYSKREKDVQPVLDFCRSLLKQEAVTQSETDEE